MAGRLKIYNANTSAWEYTSADFANNVNQFFNEVPTGLVNGSNQSYTTANTYMAGSLNVFKNGIRLKGAGNDYTETTGGFTMVTAPATGTVLLVDYNVANAIYSTDIFYPVGSIYQSTVATSPATLFGFGTWTALEGKFLVGKAAAGTFATAGATGGAETVTLTAAQSGLQAHEHAQQFANTSSGGSNYFASPAVSGYTGTTQGNSNLITAQNTAVGATESHTNLPPYKVIYMWERTA